MNEPVHPRRVGTCSVGLLQRVNAHLWKEVAWAGSECRVPARPASALRGTQKPHLSVHTHESPVWVKRPPAGIATATALLCCVALCLLGVGTSPEIICILGYFLLWFQSCFLFCPQTLSHLAHRCWSHPDPWHEVTEKGVTLSCEPIKSHAALYWYRQTSVRRLESLIYFNNQEPVDESGMPKDRFSAKMPNAPLSPLKIQPTDLGDSATYLCASSKDTALQSHPFLSRKPLLPLPAQPLASSAVFLDSSPSSPAPQCSNDPSEGKNKMKQPITLGNTWGEGNRGLGFWHFSHISHRGWQSICCCHCLVTQSCPTLCNPMDCSTPCFPVLHHIPELAQTHVRWFSDAIQQFCPL